MVACINSMLEALSSSPSTTSNSQAQVCDQSTREIGMGGHKRKGFLGYMIRKTSLGYCKTLPYTFLNIGGGGEKNCEGS